MLQSGSNNCLFFSIKSLKINFFFKLHRPTNEQNIRQILPYEARAEFCQIFRSFFGQWKDGRKNAFEIY